MYISISYAHTHIFFYTHTYIFPIHTYICICNEHLQYLTKDFSPKITLLKQSHLTNLRQRSALGCYPLENTVLWFPHDNQRWWKS